MFLGSPAWIGLLVVGTLALAASGHADRLHPVDRRRPRAARDHPLHAWFAPKIATVIDVLVRDRAAPRLRRHGARSSSSVVDRDGVLHPAVADHVGLATRCSSPACRSAAASAGSARCATITPCRGRWRCISCGRTRWPAASCSRRSSRRQPRSPARSSRRRTCAVDPARGRHRVARASARARAHRHRPPAGGNRAAGRADGARLPAVERGRGACRLSADARTPSHRCAGSLRSLRIYYGDAAARAAAMDGLYCRFVKPGDLVFDIGAHVGDRIAAFRRLGARVVAVEPQPALAQHAAADLRPRSQRRRSSAAAVGRRVGIGRSRPQCRQSDRLDRVDGFHSRSRGMRAGWQGQAWDRSSCACR